MNGCVRLRELEPSDSLDGFIELAWRVNRDDPVWVPPLRRSLKAILDRDRHPFHRHAEVAYFVAERNGETVGRVAAIVNRSHNDFHGGHTGFFGFFDSIDDRRVAEPLLETAAAWLGERGQQRMLGPTNFSTNEECGLLVEGFDSAPAVMMPHNPRYYAALLECAGLRKEKDLLAYRVDDQGGPPKLLEAGLERIAGRFGIHIRHLDLRRLPEEVRAIQEVYHSAWQDNWGFVPTTEEEFEHLARELKPVVDPELCLIAESRAGRTVGFSLALPDVNQALKALNGRLYPFGFLRYLLWERRKIDNLRILSLGVDPRFRWRGIDAALYSRTWLVGRSKGYRTAEASWILEDNWRMRRALESLGARPFKTYRIYGRPL